MANVFAPTGLVWSRNKLGAAPTAQMRAYKIANSYNTSIPVGSAVVLVGGYVTLCADNPARISGVFAGVAPYFDTTSQVTAHGRNGAYVANTVAAADMDCWIIDDPFAVFRLQFSGIAPAVTWPNLNANWVAGTNATLSTSGISVLAGSSATPAANAAFPFLIQGLAGVPGGPQDPTTTNPWLEVVINPLIHTALMVGA